MDVDLTSHGGFEFRMKKKLYKKRIQRQKKNKNYIHTYLYLYRILNYE